MKDFASGNTETGDDVGGDGGGDGGDDGERYDDDGRYDDDIGMWKRHDL